MMLPALADNIDFFDIRLFDLIDQPTRNGQEADGVGSAKGIQACCDLRSHAGANNIPFCSAGLVATELARPFRKCPELC